MSQSTEPEPASHDTVRWGIWCVVSGGVTGHREAWMKNDGIPLTFATEAEAESRASRYRWAISPYAKAGFSYTPRRYP